MQQSRSHKPWSPEQIALLREWYGRKPASRLVELLGHSEGAIYGKATQLGLSGIVGTTPWTGGGTRWNAADKVYVFRLYGTMTVKDIAKRVGRSEGSVGALLSQNGYVSTVYHPWTEDEMAYLRTNYEVMNLRDMATHLGRPYKHISHKARSLGLVNVSRVSGAYAVHDYFRQISRPVQAYILGLLATDGTVRDSGQIRPKVHKKDRVLLELMRDEFAPRTQIYPTGIDQECFYALSRQMAGDLARYGIVPRKTKILSWPEALPDNLAWAFVLGSFDGDGYISYVAKVPLWAITGQPQFLEGIAGVVLRQTGVRLRGPHGGSRAKPQDTTRYIWVTGDLARQMDAWVHRDGLGLERKMLSRMTYDRWQAQLQEKRTRWASAKMIALP